MKTIHLKSVFFVVVIILLLGCFGKKKKKAESSFLFPYEVYTQQLFSTRVSKGYMDVNGNIITDAKFWKAEPFTEGLGCVNELKNEKGILYGYIDSTGEYVIQPIYRYARPFHEGLALVSSDGKNYGFINKKGEAVTPFIFDSKTSDYHNGYCYAYKFERMVSGSDLEEAIVAIFTLGFGDASEPMYSVYKIDKYGKQEIVDSTAFGTVYADMNNWHRRNHLIRYRDNKKNYGFKRVTLKEFVRKGYQNTDTIGTIAIKPAFLTAEDFVYGYAKVSLPDGNRGYIDTTGKLVVKFEFKPKKK